MKTRLKKLNPKKVIKSHKNKMISDPSLSTITPILLIKNYQINHLK